MAKKATKAAAAKPAATPTTAKPKAAEENKLTTAAAKTQEPIPVRISNEPEGDHTKLATADDELKMRRAAVSPAARKAALDAGKKDPLEKWGDPDAAPDQVRRATFG